MTKEQWALEPNPYRVISLDEIELDLQRAGCWRITPEILRAASGRYGDDLRRGR